MSTGILDRPVRETPVAVLDFETTGLTAGIDRVVEVGVVRMDPGAEPTLVLDTLVNPQRPMAATEIHGITDDDVADAPTFGEIAGRIAKALSDTVVAAYNVYFDMRFLEYEFMRAGQEGAAPHMCLMYLRPLLGLGNRCCLSEACRAHGIDHHDAHVAGEDVHASSRLMGFYLCTMQQRGICTFRELARRGNYKFLSSFTLDPIHYDGPIPSTAGRLKSRCRGAGHELPDTQPASELPALQVPGNPVAVYWDALKVALADLQITDEELQYLQHKRRELDLREEQVRALHARAFANVITQFIGDRELDEREQRLLARLYQCLKKLGWAPGE